MINILKKNDLEKIQKNKDLFLMMDEVTIISNDEIKGKKFFDKDFWVFKHHWPGDPNIPAVFQTEVLTQISSMIILSKKEYHNKTFLIVRANNLKFKKKIIPNNTLEVYSKMSSFNRGLAKFSAFGTVNEELCCSGEFTMVLQDSLIF
jgi:3-hydroxymyristoyl/3-hydroxydecanoyl-(acyl carrier protein) dehydratase